MIVQAFKGLVHKMNPTIIFLMETKTNGQSIVKLQRKIRFDNSLAIDAVRIRGGIAILWFFLFYGSTLWTG